MSKISWQVVEFLEDNSVAAVPKNWIRKIKKSRVQCYWPKSNVETLRKKNVQCAISKSNKNFYACKVLLQGELFHSFQDALIAEKRLSYHSSKNVSQRQSTAAKQGDDACDDMVTEHFDDGRNSEEDETKERVNDEEDDACDDMVTEHFDDGRNSEEAIPQSVQHLNTDNASVTTGPNEMKSEDKPQVLPTTQSYKYWKKTIMNAYQLDSMTVNDTTADSHPRINVEIEDNIVPMIVQVNQPRTSPVIEVPVTTKSVMVKPARAVYETQNSEVTDAKFCKELICVPASIAEHSNVANQLILTSNTSHVDIRENASTKPDLINIEPAVTDPKIKYSTVADPTIADPYVGNPMNFDTVPLADQIFFDSNVTDRATADPYVGNPMNFDTVPLADQIFFDSNIADPTIADPYVGNPMNFDTVPLADQIFFDSNVTDRATADPYVGNPMNFDTVRLADPILFDTVDVDQINIDPIWNIEDCISIGMDIDFEFIDLLNNTKGGRNEESSVENNADLHDQFRTPDNVGVHENHACTDDAEHSDEELIKSTTRDAGKQLQLDDNSQSECRIHHLGSNNYQDSNGYLYTKNNCRNSNLYLRCKNNIKHQCPARVTIHNNEYNKVIMTTGHNHPPDKKILDKQIFVKQLEINIDRDPFQTPRQLYLNTKTDLKEKVELTNIPSLKKMEGLIYRRQRKHIPLLPTTVEEFEKYVVDERYREFFTKDHRNLPYFRGVWTSTKGERNLVFISESTLRMVNTMNHISFFMDGTYRALPHHIAFRQLYVISVTYENQCYPLAYIFMERKTFTSYDVIFKNLKFMMPSVEVVKLMTDYEAATRKALRKHFPNARIAGCFFHYVQAMVKSTKRFGLRNDERFQDAIKKICHLALLPNDFVLRGFESIDRTLTQTIQSTRWTRFRKYWLKQWGSANISVYGLIDRSNNFSESNNKSLNSLLMKSHPNIWYTIKTLKLMEMDKSDQLKRAIAGEMVETKRTKDVILFNEKVAKATKLFEEDQDIDRFLLRVSYGDNVELFVKHQVNITDETSDADIDEDYDEEIIPNNYDRESDFRRNHPRQAASKLVEETK